MSRPSLERLSQDQLTSELKRWIDTARYALDDSRAYERAVAEVLRLTEEHPQSSLRPHVMHNLGGVRRRWLGQLAAKLTNRPILEEIGRWRTA